MLKHYYYYHLLSSCISQQASHQTENRENLSPKTGWISWLHFKKYQAPAALLSVGNAGALRIKPSCQPFSAVDFPSYSLFRTQSHCFPCNNNGDLWLFSASFIYGLRHGHSASSERHKLSALCLWSERGVWLKHLFTFATLFPTQTRVCEDMYDYVFLQHKGKDEPDWRITFSFLWWVYCKQQYMLWGLGSVVECQTAVSSRSRCLKCATQKAFLSLRAGLCHGLFSLDVAEPMALVLQLTGLKSFFYCQELTMDAC